MSNQIVARKLSMNLTSKEKEQLVLILGCQEDELEDKISLFQKAASEEYLRMILGKKVFTRGQDMLEYRLFLMIQYVFIDSLPSEQQISALFQTSTAQSRSLLRAVMSKYQYDLQLVVDSTLKAILQNATLIEGGEGYQFTVDSDNVVQTLNRRIAAIDGTLPQVTKVKNSVTTYSIAVSAYKKLTE